MQIRTTPRWFQPRDAVLQNQMEIAVPVLTWRANLLARDLRLQFPVMVSRRRIVSLLGTKLVTMWDSLWHCLRIQGYVVRWQHQIQAAQEPQEVILSHPQGQVRPRSHSIWLRCKMWWKRKRKVSDWYFIYLLHHFSCWKACNNEYSFDISVCSYFTLLDPKLIKSSPVAKVKNGEDVKDSPKAPTTTTKTRPPSGTGRTRPSTGKKNPDSN